MHENIIELLFHLIFKASILWEDVDGCYGGTVALQVRGLKHCGPICRGSEEGFRYHHWPSPLENFPALQLICSVRERDNSYNYWQLMIFT